MPSPTLIPVTIPETTVDIKPDAITSAIQQAYEIIDQLHLSPLVLGCIAFVLSLTLLFCLRELAAWFFKTNGLKKDLREIQKEITQLQADVRALQQPPAPQAEPLKEMGAKESPSKFRINH